MRDIVKGFPFWNPLPLLRPELNIVSVVVTLQILVISFLLLRTTGMYN